MGVELGIGGFQKDKNYAPRKGWAKVKTRCSRMS